MSPQRPTSLLVYIVDTLSARHLGVYGYDRETSPNIDAFAGEAIVFEQAFAQSSWTKTSMASVHTGLLPWSHGVLGRDSVLPDAAETLAEMLHEAGYRTGAAVTITTASALFGFSQGFDEFRENLEINEIELHQRADRLNVFAEEWLAAASGSAPFFLYLHASDPHTPYTPPNPFRERLAPGVDLDDRASHRTDLRGWKPADARELRWFNNASRALYDAEIAYVDAQFGALLESLREHGLYDDLTIVLAADHGEVFGSHGRYTHGNSLFEDVLQVPLIVKLPGRWGAGSRVAGRVQQADILPTVLAALGRPIPENVEGRDLLPTVFAGVPPDTVTAARLRLGSSDLESVAAGGYKLIVDSSARRRPPRRFLYDLNEDPGETVNLWGRHPVLQRFLAAELRLVRRRGADVVTEETELDPETEAHLRALGYIQ